MSVEVTEAEAIERTREAHVAALNSGDVDGWVASFAEDGIQMPPNFPANVGRDNIHAWSAAFLGAFQAEFLLAVEEVQLAGSDWAFERGSYEIALTPRSGGERTRDAGKYITVYERTPAVAGPWHGTSGTATTRRRRCDHRRDRGPRWSASISRSARPMFTRSRSCRVMRSPPRLR